MVWNMMTMMNEPFSMYAGWWKRWKTAVDAGYNSLSGMDDRFSPFITSKKRTTRSFFKNSKVVYSLFNDEFSKPFHAQFAESLLLQKALKEEPPDQHHRQRNWLRCTLETGSDHSDEVIQSSKTVHPALVEYVAEKKMKFFTLCRPRRLCRRLSEFLRQSLKKPVFFQQKKCFTSNLLTKWSLISYFSLLLLISVVFFSCDDSALNLGEIYSQPPIKSLYMRIR